MSKYVAVECLRDFPWDEMRNPRGSLVAMTEEQCRMFEAERMVRRRPDVDASSIPPSFVRRKLQQESSLSSART